MKKKQKKQKFLGTTRKIKYPVVVIAIEDGWKGSWKKGDLLLCLGEISNMLGHIVVVCRKTGKIFWGVHEWTFRIPTDNEY